MIKEIECIIKGRVQLVMFRDFIQRNGVNLKLVGTVQNLPDGNVKVVAQGEEKILKNLIKKLHDGPLLARVDSVDVIWREPTEKFQSFKIVY